MRPLERSAVFVYNRWLDADNRLTRLLIRRSGVIRRAAFATTLVAYPAFCGLSWAGTLARRALGKKPRIVWGPTPILTIAESSELLRRLGYPSTTVVFTTYHIRSDFDVNLKRAVLNPAVGYWLPNLLHLWSLLRFDVFHFFFDGGLWSGMNIIPSARWLELPLLRLAGKRVIASAYGADVRVRHLNEMWQPFNICQECPAPGVYCVCGTHGLERAKYYRDWCNAVLAMGDMHDFVFDSRPDFNYWPIDVQSVAFAGAAPRPGSVRVVHSPNHQYFKGTRFLEAAIAALRARGHDVDLDLVEGVPNEEAKRRYAEADIVFAQCLAGWMGYTELEAMAVGKPVIGYIRNPSYLAHTEGSPLVSATPATLEQELEALVADPARREELGRRGREYIEREWSYEALAPAYDALHREVWERNRLLRTLRRKWTDLRLGESRYRVGQLTGSQLRELVVYADPRLDMRRILSGAFGQPPIDADGIPRVYRGGSNVEDSGMVARYALNAFQLNLLEPSVEEHRSRFAIAARWLRDNLEIDGDGVGRWQPASDVSQSLGLSVLLRAEQMHPGESFGESATAAAEAFRVRSDLMSLVEPANVSGFMTGMFGLHEYHRVRGEPWAAELFDRCVVMLQKTLAESEAPGGPLDDNYLVVQQLLALHEITGLAEFRSLARNWARRLCASRAKDFVRLRAPL
jgi:hypothetical protein